MDIMDIATGFGLGLLVSGLYFAGLYATVRAAGRTRYPGALLAISAAVRLGLFLLAVYFTLRLGLAGGAGFFVGFLLVRQFSVARFRPRTAGLRSA